MPQSIDQPPHPDGSGVYVNVHVTGAGMAWTNAPSVAWEAISELELLLTTMAEDLGGEMLSQPGDMYRIRFVSAAPAVMWSARMQEGLTSLYQMSKVNSMLKKLSSNKIPFISVLTDPTMGGVSASFAMIGDVVISEPGALIGFAGPRVIQQTVNEKLPENFQKSEFLFENGLIDLVIHRHELKTTIFSLLDIIQKK